LPDFFGYNIAKWEEIYQMTTVIYKWP
jgi:hypothetical protein